MKRRILMMLMTATLTVALLTGCGSSSDQGTVEKENTDTVEEENTEAVEKENTGSEQGTTTNHEEIARLMAAEVPEWAAAENLTSQDVTFVIYDDGYENGLKSADIVTGTYIYDKNTGVYTLDDDATVTETSDGYTYEDEDREIDLIVYAEERSSIGELIGTSKVEVPGGYVMNIPFTMNLYGDNTYELANDASPSVFTGTWEKEEDGSYVIFGEGMTTGTHTYDAATGITSIEINGVLSDVPFNVTVEGTVQ